MEGNRQIEFSFKTSDINDLLKSMVVQDNDGGTVSSVNYGSPEPLEKTLRTFTVDLTHGPTLAEIFQQLRGQEVQLEATDVVKGKVIGVERRNMPTGDKEVTQVEVVNLRTEDGVRSVRIDSLVRTKIMDPKVDKEFQQALLLLAGASSTDKKQVKLDFQGKGKRKVSVGYIQEAPVWKTSYRLVLKDDKSPMLQGWAIVENTTAQDWQNVELSLVSGRPISFQMDLYQPMFITRPFAKLLQHAQLTARTYSQDMEKVADVETAASAYEISPNGMVGGMGGMGGGGGMEGGIAGAVRKAMIAGYGGKAAGINLASGVNVVSDASEVGELFRYAIKDPVTLPRNESAMLPIVNHEIKAEKVAIFNAYVHAKHPLSGLKLTNTTDLHWLQGPITLFDGGEYAGDAQIEDVPPKASRLISYALDLETEVVSETSELTEQVTALSVQKGGLHMKKRLTRHHTFTVKNASGKAKRVLIELPIDNYWKVAKPKPEETTRDTYRFAIEVPAGKSSKLVIEEEQPQVEVLVLTDLDPAKLEVILQIKAASPAVQKVLKELLAKKTKVVDLQHQRTALNQEKAAIIGDQQQVRNNLAALPEIKPGEVLEEATKKTRDDLLKRYLGKMTAFENTLDEQRERDLALQKEEAAAAAALSTFELSATAE